MVGGVAVKKTLAAIDRSKYKEKIIVYAISLGKAWGAEVTAIHVIDPGRGVPGKKLLRNPIPLKKQLLTMLRKTISMLY